MPNIQLIEMTAIDLDEELNRSKEAYIIAPMENTVSVSVENTGVTNQTPIVVDATPPISKNEVKEIASISSTEFDKVIPTSIAIDAVKDETLLNEQNTQVKSVVQNTAVPTAYETSVVKKELLDQYGQLANTIENRGGGVVSNANSVPVVKKKINVILIILLVLILAMLFLRNK